MNKTHFSGDIYSSVLNEPYFPFNVPNIIDWTNFEKNILHSVNELFKGVDPHACLLGEG